MGLGIYSEPVASSRITDNTDTGIAAPFTVSIDGKAGGFKTQRLYLRNDDATLTFTDISLVPVDTGSPSVVDGSQTGFSWKLLEEDTQPTEEAWDLIDDGNTIEFSDLGTILVTDIATYLPFWARIEIPRNTDVQAIASVELTISATSTLI